uniref:Uncharacterized protein n=2 Tax=Acrobeloides nanus TaxID=290746 RepID=A0A914E5P3_9BILA
MRRQGQPFGTTNQQYQQRAVHPMAQYPSTSSDPNYGNAQQQFGQPAGWPGFAGSMQYPSGSKSACASPGPVQKFRQTYCKKDSFMPGTHGSPNQKPINQHTTLWMQNYHGHGAYPSYSSSEAPSVISNMSGYSVVSNLSQLSIATDMTDTPYLYEYMPQQPSSTASGSSMAENIDPDFYQKMDNFTETLILNLNHPHPEEQRKAVGSLYHAAKLEQFSYVTTPERLQRLINQVFHIISQPTLDEEVKHRLLAAVFHLISCKSTLQAVQMVFLQSRGGVVHVLCNLLNPEMKYTNYTVCILNTLFRQPGKFGGQCRQCARTKAVIDRHIQILEANIGVRIYIAVDNIKLIINSCEELKVGF